MKFIIALILTFTSASALANFPGGPFGNDAKYEIKQAIAAACGTPHDLTHLETKETVEMNEDVIVRYQFESQFSMKVEIDFDYYETYIVIVNSSIITGNGHQEYDWGMLDVDRVSCMVF